MCADREPFHARSPDHDDMQAAEEVQRFIFRSAVAMDPNDVEFCVTYSIENSQPGKFEDSRSIIE